LSCRVLLSTCLDAERVGCSEAADFTATLAALAALAWNVGDLEISRSRLVQHIGLLSPQERAQARRRLSRSDRQRLPLRGSASEVLALFDGISPAEEEPQVMASTPPPAAGPAAAPAVAAPPGLRDMVQN
ncbi:unnamed protein product, partial [Polarella glacialis]